MNRYSPILEELDVGLVAFPHGQWFLTGQYGRGSALMLPPTTVLLCPSSLTKLWTKNAALLKLLADMAAEKVSNLGPDLHGLDVV